MSVPLQVWSLIWPHGIPPEDYERAMLMIQLTKERQAIKPKSARQKEPVLYTVPQAAKILKVHPATLLLRIRKGTLPATKKGLQFRILPADIRHFRKFQRHPRTK